MDQRPSWEANTFPESQEIPRYLRNLQVNHRLHANPPLAVSWARSVLSTTSKLISWKYMLIVYSQIPCAFFPSSFPTKALYTPSPGTVLDTFPAHLILLVLIARIIFGEEHKSWTFSSCSFGFLSPHTSWTQMSSSAFFVENPSAYIPPLVWETKFDTCIQQKKIVSKYAIFFFAKQTRRRTFLGRNITGIRRA